MSSSHVSAVRANFPCKVSETRRRKIIPGVGCALGEVDAVEEVARSLTVDRGMTLGIPNVQVPRGAR